MATKIVTKNSSTASAVPTASDLVQGELAVNVADKRLFTEDNGGAIVELGTNPYNFTANHDGLAKLTTTSTGIDVTGTATMDGLVVDGNAVIDGGATDNTVLTLDSGTANTYLKMTDSNSTSGVFIGATTNDLNLYPNNTLSAKFSAGGDISFYEDTGTTAKFFWDASAEALGIGTSSPSDTLSVVNLGSSGTGIQISSGTASGDLRFKARTESYNGILSVYDSGNNEDVRISAHSGVDTYFNSGSNVGIGTSSPDTLVQATNTSASTNYISYEIGNSGISSANKGGFAIYELGSLATSITYARDGTGHTDFNADTLVFNNAANNTERMRIDSSGNLLVGQSATTVPGVGNTTAGSAIGSAGYIFVSKSGDTPAHFNRNTNDGDIITLRKNGTTVGSIGTMNFGDMYLGTDDTGIYFNNGIDSISPINTTSQALRDNAISLGASNARFKDLYLSGGVYLGGTGAANHLDDYEEGTWTGTLTGSTSAPITAITATGTYTKIGRSVTAVISFSNKDSTGVAGNIIITGLPFTASAGGVGAGWHSRSNTGTGTTNGVMSYIASNNDLVLLNGLGIAITWVSTGTGTYAGYSITYEV